MLEYLGKQLLLVSQKQADLEEPNPSMLLAYSIAKVFDVAIEDLFDFEEAQK